MNYKDKFYSQADQDKFVLSVLNYKKDGYFVEIGSNHPIFMNNTFKLESEYNWKGVLIDYDNKYEDLYKSLRKSNYIIKDASKIDYKELFIKNKFPKNIDYLQIDLDVDNKSTLNTLLLLDNTILSDYIFSVITFEHDIYIGNYYNTREKSREILLNRGYILVYPDVIHNNRVFEDWYLHPSKINIEYINKIKRDESLNHDDIIKILENNMNFHSNNVL